MSETIMTTAVERNGDIIAAEINIIKDEAASALLKASIEIGKRLCEAKELIPHGQFTEWLKNSVDYSQSTANNLMRIFKEYGDEQVSLLSGRSKSQAFKNLSYSQAVALFSVPEDEREEFASENEVEKMSAREIKQLIDEKRAEEEKREAAEQELKAASGQLSEEQAARQSAEQKLRETEQKLKDETKKLKAKLKAEKEKDISPQERERITAEIKKKIEQENKDKIKQLQIDKKSAEDEAERQNRKAQEQIEQALKEAKEAKAKLIIAENRDMQKFNVLLEQLQENFNKMSGIIIKAESDTAQKLKSATIKVLQIMSESMV